MAAAKNVQTNKYHAPKVKVVPSGDNGSNSTRFASPVSYRATGYLTRTRAWSLVDRPGRLKVAVFCRRALADAGFEDTVLRREGADVPEEKLHYPGGRERGGGAVQEHDKHPGHLFLRRAHHRDADRECGAEEHARAGQKGGAGREAQLQRRLHPRRLPQRKLLNRRRGAC
eukprot:1386376-Pyramimonas_sp.AAC.2